MADIQQSFMEPFPPASLEQWREKAEAGLKGASFEEALSTKTHEGIQLKPLYTQQDLTQADEAGFPGFAPFTRGNTLPGSGATGWEIHQAIRHPDPLRAAEEINANLNQGVHSVWLHLNDAFQAGAVPSNSGVHCNSVEDFAKLQPKNDAGCEVGLEVGGNGLAGLALLLAQRGDDATLQGSINLDPLGTLARVGRLPGSLQDVYNQMAAITRFSIERHAPLRTISVSTTPSHRAGGNAVQELACALSTGVTYLREMTSRGLELNDVLPRMGFRFSMGRHFFMEMAKLRAARTLWARVAQTCGVDAPGGMHIHAETSHFTGTRRDPFVNLLRGTSQAFAAIAGGANQITTTPFDQPLGQSSDFSQRLAAHTQVVLNEESHLGIVIDPAGGSFYIESLSRELAQRAWTHFQEMEKEGGITTALQTGTLQAGLEKSWLQKRDAVEHRRDPITGVSEFPHLNETPLTTPTASPTPTGTESPGNSFAAHAALSGALKEGSTQAVHLAVDALQNGTELQALLGALWENSEPPSVSPLPAHTLAEPFEELRDRSDHVLATAGKRPSVFLANLGSIPQHKARATFARNFFEAGGIETHGNDGFETTDALVDAFRRSEALWAVLCSSDKVYADQVEETAGALRDAGAQVLLLAGKPGEHEARYRDAGIDSFIYTGCNAYQTLHQLYSRQGEIS
jgi:methylmalonyl-CoA mutase